MSMFLKRLNLQFFSADTGSEGGASSTEDTKQADTKQDTKSDENMIPKSRFDEINSKYKEMQSKFDEMAKASQQAEEQRQAKEKEEAEKRGEFEKLYREKASEVDNLITFKERTESLEGVINGLVETELQAIPEEFHDLIPENLNSEQKLSWINKAKSKGMFKVAEQEDVSIGKRTNPKETKRDTKAMSAMEKLMMAYGKR
ncbi:hypothetical protein Q9R38_25955 [Priestia aryabhattai]|uniref:hypothetical protein n=1 Tax=Priestia aryabhattai TaxID=412384 RepID=UPI002880C3CD|nr:hypothetical protein [Priestia aryabhattai]MDT0149988.1 hypothetical protein [Priestia aryabhattai]MDT0155558.1 hypothetical protein [Priestia aryabhattai]